MSNLDLIRISLENLLYLIELKLDKTAYNVSRADLWARYIQAEKERVYPTESESKKKKELERLRKELTLYTIKALKIADIILNDINNCMNILNNNRNAYWHSTLFNRFVEIKSKLDNHKFDAKSLKDKFGDNNIDFKNINLEEDDYTINEYDLIKMGIHFKDYSSSYFDDLKQQYGRTDEANKDIIQNGYTQRCSSFDLNRKLRNGQSLKKDENKIYSAIINACNNNKLNENKYFFRYVSQEFINKYNVKFDRLNQISISNAIYKFKKNIIDKNIKEKESGLISSSCDIYKNVFKSRDVLLILYVEKGSYLYVTNNDQESEVIFPSGMIYHFFDCFFIERKLFGEKCYQMVIKTFLKNNY